MTSAEPLALVLFFAGLGIGLVGGAAITAVSYHYRAVRAILRRRTKRVPVGDGGYPPVGRPRIPPPPLPPPPSHLRAMTPEERGADFRRSYFGGVVHYHTPPTGRPPSQRFVHCDDPSIDERIAELRRGQP